MKTKEIGQGNLHSIFAELAATLASKVPGRTWGLVICGGAAMIALGLRATNTRDIDVLEPELDESLKQAADEVRLRHGLRTDWINNGPSSLIPHLPSDWKNRLQPVFQSSSLLVYAIGRPELLVSKLWAEADRQEDIDDLVSLSPTVEELTDAARLVATYDANPDWPKHVERTVAKVLRALGKKA